MELSALSNVDLINAFKVPELSSSLDDTSTGSVKRNGAFEAVFNSAANMISDANDYSNAAEVEEMKYSMGETYNLYAVWTESKSPEQLEAEDRKSTRLNSSH